MYVLTDSQKKARDYQRHLSVTANAGSGKTTVLVDRFVDILQFSDTKINQLVALTFTDKAAGELRTKIAATLNRRISFASDRMAVRKLEETRDQLAFANIGTIHSFCAKLLREYPVEADIDAAFTVLEGIDQETIQAEVFRELFERLLGDSRAQEKRLVDTATSLQLLLRTLGRNKVQSFLNIFLNKREQLQRLTSDGGVFANSLTDEQILVRWQKALEDIQASELHDPRWREAVHRLCAVAKGKHLDTAHSNLSRWNASADIAAKLQVYNDIIDVVLTKDDDIRADFVGRGTDRTPFEEERQLLAAHRSRLSGFLTGNWQNGQKLLLRLTRAFLLVHSYALDLYEQKKEEKALLDYEDLQLKVRTLLSDESTRGRIAREYKFIMVDEYQDTNLLQYEILRGLIEEFRGGNLFIVGDPKQSIYGFRDADVRVFETTKQDILSSGNDKLPFSWNGIELDSETEELSGRVVLAHSFRLLTNLVAFVNRVFSRTMGESQRNGNRLASSEYEIVYEELFRGRTNEEPGAVEFLLLKENGNTEEEESTSEELIRQECTLIARRLNLFHTEQHTIYEPHSERPRPFEFSDAAILIRGRTHLAHLEKALVNNHVPYLISGGIGFYQKQEVYDFFNYFKFLLNPHDDVALVGVLRSPFFMVSDAELFRIGTRATKDDFWSKLKSLVESGQGSRELILAKKVLEDNIDVANRFSISDLVQRLFDHTGWLGTNAGVESGVQSRANVQKLLRIAGDFEKRGYGNLFDFVERLKTLLSEEREGQASLDLSANAVQIMTIHAAKGLEFPVVFVPFCHQKFSPERSPIIDLDFGIGFKVPDEINHGKDFYPPIADLIMQRARERSAKEEKRIFFVACTRARDMLIFSARKGIQTTRRSYLKWTLDALELDAEHLADGTHTIPGLNVMVLRKNSERLEPAEISHNLKIEIRSKVDLSLESTVPKREHSTIPKSTLLLGRLQANTNKEFFSATQIKTFIECPTKYFLKYELGLSEQHPNTHKFNEEEDPNDKVLGQLRGLAVHAVLENIVQSLTDSDLMKLVERVLFQNALQNESENQQLSAEVFEYVRGFLDSEIGMEVLGMKPYFIEYTINVAFEENFLTGTIDRLVKDSDGAWRVVDYKTDSVLPTDVVERSELYRPQLAFYAFLVHRLYGQSSVKASLIFTALQNTWIDFVFEKSEIISFEEVLRESIHRIKEKDFHREFEICASCPYLAAGSCIL